MSPVISADVPEELEQHIEDAREEGESRSAAVRRLIRTGLDAEEGRRPTFIGTAVSGLNMAGFVLVAFALTESDPMLAIGGITAVALAAVTSRFGHSIDQKLP